MDFRAHKDKSGKVNYQRDLIKAYLDNVKNDTYLKISINRLGKTESDPMRKYYFSTVLPLLMDHVGYEPHEKMFFHNQLKQRCFCPEPDENGFFKVPSVFGKKSEITIERKQKFIEWVKRLAAQMSGKHGDGVYIPDPNEQ